MKTGFTLVELLVVIAILAILMALLFPVFRSADESGRRTVCLSKFSQLSLAENIYRTEHDDVFVPGVIETGGAEILYDKMLAPYSTAATLWSCPSAHPSDSAKTRSIGMNRAMATSYDGTNPAPKPVAASAVSDPSATILLSEDVPATPNSLAPLLLRKMVNPNVRNACLSAVQEAEGHMTNDIGRAMTRHSGAGNYAMVDGSTKLLRLSTTLSPRVRWFAGSAEFKFFAADGALTSENCSRLGASSPIPGADPTTGN